MRRIAAKPGQTDLKRYAEGFAARREVLSLRRTADRASRQAADAERTKRNFLSGLNHELRTPLNHIIGFAELLRDPDGFGVSDEKRAEYIGHILTSAGDLLGEIDRILDEAGYGQTGARAAEGGELVPVLRRLLEEHGATLFVGKVDIADDLPETPLPSRDLYKSLQGVFSVLSDTTQTRRAIGLTATAAETGHGSVRLALTLLSGSEGLEPAQLRPVRSELARLGARLDHEDGGEAGERLIVTFPTRTDAEAA